MVLHNCTSGASGMDLNVNTNIREIVEIANNLRFYSVSLDMYLKVGIVKTICVIL